MATKNNHQEKAGGRGSDLSLFFCLMMMIMVNYYYLIEVSLSFFFVL